MLKRQSQAAIASHVASLYRALQLFTQSNVKYLNDVRMHAQSLCAACGFQWSSGRDTYKSNGKNMADCATVILRTGAAMTRHCTPQSALALAHALSNFDRARLRLHDKMTKPRIMRGLVFTNGGNKRDMRAGAQGEPDPARVAYGMPHTALDWAVSPTIGRNPAQGVMFKHEQTAAIVMEMMRNDPSLRKRLLRDAKHDTYYKGQNSR